MGRLTPLFGSLRVQWALVGLGVQLLVAGLVLWQLNAYIERGLTTEMSLRVAHSAPLLEAALVEPLIQRDYATASQILAEVVNPDDFNYLVLLDAKNRMIASAGRAPDAALPPIDTDLQSIPWYRADATLHRLVDIGHAGQRLGQLRYGVSLHPFIAMQRSLVVNSAWVTVVGAAAGALLLALAGIGLTRGLNQLLIASEAISQERFGQRLPESGSHEFARLAMAFNRMSAVLDQRFTELVLSQAEQAHYLEVASAETARLLALLNALKLGVLLVDNQQKVLYANAAFTTLWPQHALRIAHTPPLQAVRADIAAVVGWSDATPSRFLSMPPLSSRASRHRLELPDGKQLEQSSFPVTDAQGLVVGRVWLFEDVTAEHQATALIHRMAATDSLTGLLNRHTFFVQLNGLMAAVDAKPLAVLFIDLDKFKLINDLMGHAAGDKVLVRVAEALTQTLRPHDLIARIGGDEFAVALQDLQPAQLNTLCERLQRHLALIGTGFDNQPAVHVGASIGVAWFPTHGTDANVLLAAADQAMYLAKSEGRGIWRLYDTALSDHSAMSEWMTWANRLSEALERQGLKVYLQGVYEVDTLKLHHYEALVRMHNPADPDHPFQPGDFILHAENSGKILALDRWMLSTCIHRLAQMPQHPAIAVNVSARSLVDAQLPEFVRAELAEAGVAPHRLHLELTETLAVSRLDLAEQGVRQLQAIGCVVSLDDFGSGFTSIAYLKQLPADCIKIDGQLVMRLASDVENQILLRAIVDIAHMGGKKVVAEWIEDTASLSLVKSFGIDWVQGYLFGLPLPMEQVEH